MTSHHHHHHHPTELDSGTTDSVASSPRSDHPPNYLSINDDTQPRVRFMCSFGGKILPRPHDNQLRYVGGDTRIVAVNRHTTFASLLNKLSKLAGTTNITVKYQLPSEDLDALITVTADDDVENMMDEYDRFVHNNNNVHSKASRLRLFLFSNDAISRTSSISSLLGGSAKREHWFLDALNGGEGPGSGLDRGRSEVSSIVSEVPDYLFGLDNSDELPREPRLKTRLNLTDNVSNSDPGSPAAVISSPFCSTSSSLAPSCVPSIPGLPPVKTKPDPVSESREVRVGSFAEPTEPLVAQQPSYAGNTQWHYVSDPHYQSPSLQHIPVYYVPSPVPSENVSVHQVPIRAPYAQPFPAPPGQMPVGFRQMVQGMGQVYSGGVRPMDPYDMSGRVVPEGVNQQQVYYGVRNTYPGGMVMPGGEELPASGAEAKLERVSHF